MNVMQSPVNQEQVDLGEGKEKGSGKRAFILGILGIVITLFMAIALVYWWEYVRLFEDWGYLGAFLISILGGSTIIVPVPMLAVVFALGGILKPYWVGVAAGAGDTVGALIIYMAGHGAGVALFNRTNGRLQKAYARLMRLIEQRGSITLFVLSAILNPFFYPAALAYGALQFGIKRYFIICWVGKTIKGFTVAYAGYWGLRGILRLFGISI